MCYPLYKRRLKCERAELKACETECSPAEPAHHVVDMPVPKGAIPGTVMAQVTYQRYHGRKDS